MTPPFRVSHVVFDVDGTLVDFVAAYRAGMRAAAEIASTLAGRTVTVEELRDAQRSAASELRDGTLSPNESRRQAFRAAVASLGCDEGEVASVVAGFERARDGLLQPYADVEETVAGLHERGIAMVAASNGSAEMAGLPLLRRFSATWFAEAAGVSKPDPRFFLGALSSVGARPEAALMVGDRLDNDYEPARAAGMHAVLIDRAGKVEDASVLRIRLLTELLDLVVRDE